jgi:insulysin
MSLCLVGNHTLNQLQDLALQNFSQVEDRNSKIPDYSKDIMYDSDTALGHLIKIAPVKDIRKIEIKWPMLPDSRHYWNGDPLDYISHLIGHEGKTSLLSELIRQDLATSISSGNY